MVLSNPPHLFYNVLKSGMRREAAETETDEALFGRYLGGDKSGMAGLVDRYGDSLTLYIGAIIGDAQDAEDLMIEAFSRICARGPQLSEGGFRPYLYKTARNLAFRFAAKNRLRRNFGFDDLQAEPESEEFIERTVQTKERDRVLHLCMEKLAPDYREALYLTYFEDMSRAEAAAVLGKREKQVENLVYRGKKALRALLESEGITDAHDF